jgi:hypothetical protein
MPSASYEMLVSTRTGPHGVRITNSVAQEPEGSSPHSQQPATGPCPETVESNPHPPKPVSLRSILIPTYALVFPVVSFLRAFPPKPCTLFSPLPCVPHARPPHSPWLNLPNDIWGWVQIMKFLIVQLPPFSRHLIPLRSKYSNQNPVLKHPQFMLFPQRERPSFTPIQNNW